MVFTFILNPGFVDAPFQVKHLMILNVWVWLSHFSEDGGMKDKEGDRQNTFMNNECNEKSKCQKKYIYKKGWNIQRKTKTEKGGCEKYEAWY